MRLAALLLATAFGSASASPARAASIEAYSASLDAQWDYARPAESEARFRDELARWPDGDPQALVVATQIARSQGLQRQFAAANGTLDGVLAKLDGAPSHVRVRYLLERGRVLNSSGAPERAVPLFAEALSLAQCSDDAFYAIDAAHMLGIAAPPGERLGWNLKALTMAEAAVDPRARRWRAPLYNNLGEIRHERREYAQARTDFRHALAAYETRGNLQDLRFARWKVGRAERMLGRLEEAQRIQLELANETERAGEPDGYVYEELAEIALARGDATAAKPWAVKAYALLKDDPDLKAEEPARLARLGRLAGDPTKP
jgi:tetratricopeptide (TPR) repeat protein